MMDLYHAADIFVKVCGLALLGMIVQEFNRLYHFCVWLYDDEDGEDNSTS